MAEHDSAAAAQAESVDTAELVDAESTAEELDAEEPRMLTTSRAATPKSRHGSGFRAPGV